MTAELGAEDRAPELVPLNAIFATDFVQILVPVTTANTRMRTPEVMTWPRTGSAMNEVPRQRAKGTRMKPFSVVSLNSTTARKSMIASTKKATSVTTQERAISMISLKFQNTSGKPERRWIWASSTSAPCTPA